MTPPSDDPDTLRREIDEIDDRLPKFAGPDRPLDPA